MTRVLAILAAFALTACFEGFDAAGKWRDGIPSFSGYYVDPARNCIRVGQVNNGMSTYHADVLLDRTASGERMCEESAYWLAVAARVAGRAAAP